LRKLVNSPGGNNRVARTLEVLAPASEAAQTFTGRYAIFNFSHAHHRLHGYLWDFPSRKKGLPFNNRGIYDTGLFVNKKRRSLPQLLTAFLSSLGSNPESVSWQGHPIHLFDPGRRLSVPGLMLVGDAAGIDPALGEGIGPSLAYGQVAAQTIQDAFQRGDFSLRAYHRRVLQSRVGQYLSFRWFVAETVYRFAGLPGFMSLFWAFAYLVNRLAPEPPPLYSD
jgi:flavin-dependent dehydrogenase